MKIQRWGQMLRLTIPCSEQAAIRTFDQVADLARGSLSAQDLFLTFWMVELIRSLVDRSRTGGSGPALRPGRGPSRPAQLTLSKLYL